MAPSRLSKLTQLVLLYGAFVVALKVEDPTIKCFDIKRTLNYLCYRICRHYEYDFGYWNSTAQDCVCDDKDYRWEPHEAKKIVILNPLATQLSSQPEPPVPTPPKSEYWDTGL